MVHPGHRAGGGLSVPQSDQPDPGPAWAWRDTLSYLRISAGVIWPVTAPPFGRGALLADAAGRIVAVGLDADVPRPPGAAHVSYPGAVVLPGLVNAHTHLELHSFRGQVTEREFFAWIQAMRRIRETTSATLYHEAAQAGVLDAWRHGTTTVADTGVSGATVHALTEMGGRGVYYQEVLGPQPEQVDRTEAALRRSIDALRRVASADVRIGVSPHAPYSVHPDLVQRAITYARTEALPLAMHVGESRAELAFVTQGIGPFADNWRARGIALPPPARSPVAAMHRLGVLGPDFLAIHVVHADAEDVATLRESGCAVAACPRSNQRHAQGIVPLAALLAAGVPVGLGTDSVVSVDSLDLLAEARLARESAGLSAEAALRLITIDGARAVGLGDSVGSLEPGKWADLCIIRLAGRPTPHAEPLAQRLLHSEASCIIATWVSGRCVHGAGASRSERPRRGGNEAGRRR